MINPFASNSGIVPTTSTYGPYQGVYPGSVLSGKNINQVYQDDHAILIQGDSIETSDILRSMMEKSEFVTLSSEDAIAKLGNVDPMKDGHPNGIAEALRRCAPSAREGYLRSVSGTGLFYALPKMFSKADRIRTTYSGVALLDHWAEKHKRFAPFVDAYLPDWVRSQIASECVDLGFGKMPKWIKEELDHCEKLQKRHHDKVMREMAIKQQRHQAELQKMYEAQRTQMVQMDARTSAMKKFLDAQKMWEGANQTASPKKPSAFGSLFEGL